MEPNNYAVVVVLFVFTLTILLWWKDLQRWHRLAIISIILLYLFLLAQTYSRTGMILFILATASFLVKFRKRIGLRRIVIVGGTMVVLFSGLASERLVERFSSISQVKGMTLSDDKSIGNRIGLTLMLPKMLAINPISGIGPGNIIYLTSRSDSREYVARNLQGVGYRSHNQYVELIGETGIIGFSIFVLLIGLCIRDLRFCRRRLVSSDGSFLWCLVEALTLIMPLYFIAAATLEVASKQTFWILVAIPIIIRRLLEKEAAAADSGLVPEFSPHQPSTAAD